MTNGNYKPSTNTEGQFDERDEPYRGSGDGSDGTAIKPTKPRPNMTGWVEVGHSCPKCDGGHYMKLGEKCPKCGYRLPEAVGNGE